MSTIKKAGMLIVILALPAFFFVFLKIFGTNHFDLPYFYPKLGPDGEVQMNGADTVFYQISVPLGVDYISDTVPYDVLDNRITFFFLSDSRSKNRQRFEDTMLRLTDRLRGQDSVQFLYRVGPFLSEAGPAKVVPGYIGITTELTPDLATILKASPSVRGQSLDPDVSNLVLVDQKRRIRGYYDVMDPDDFERAIAEAKILLYQNKTGRHLQ